MFDLIKTLVKWTLIMAAAGELKSATLYMMREAAKASAPGLISLSKLNRALQAPSAHTPTKRGPHQVAR